MYHGADRTSSTEPINFLFSQSFSEYAHTKSLFKVHSCLMVFAWMFCASSGILLKRWRYDILFYCYLIIIFYFHRYYKFLWPQDNLQKGRFWFFMYQFLMLSCVVVSIVSFLVVLSALKWNLMSNNIANKTSFVHSICGLATLALMLIQVKLEFNFKKELF